MDFTLREAWRKFLESPTENNTNLLIATALRAGLSNEEIINLGVPANEINTYYWLEFESARLHLDLNLPSTISRLIRTAQTAAVDLDFYQLQRLGIPQEYLELFGSGIPFEYKDHLEELWDQHVDWPSGTTKRLVATINSELYRLDYLTEKLKPNWWNPNTHGVWQHSPKKTKSMILGTYPRWRFRVVWDNVQPLWFSHSMERISEIALPAILLEHEPHVIKDPNPTLRGVYRHYRGSQMTDNLPVSITSVDTVVSEIDEKLYLFHLENQN